MMAKMVTEEAPTRELQEAVSAPANNEDLTYQQAVKQIQTRVPQEVVRAPASSEEIARQQAVKQIQRRRQFQFEVLVSAIVMLLVAVIWATTEYNNASGWPTNGFSQSSSIHDVWNILIIYPFMAWVLYLSTCGYIRAKESSPPLSGSVGEQGRECVNFPAHT
jgi:hypothetical protein